MLEEPDVMSKRFGSSSGSYPDLDRFDRVTTSKWTKDLASDRDFYHVDLAYDRNSNITSAEDQVHSGFDVLYTNDGLNRLVRAEEGTLSGGSITSRSRDQQWTLNQTGNWELDKVDLNGDGDFIDADELNDDRTHNAVNELLARDTDDNGTDNFTFAYDEAGNLTDDGEQYTYEWDAFYRLRKVRNRSTQALVAEYKYNGLGYRISIYEDTDDDGEVDGNDKWFHHAFDERWRWVGTFRESDTDPKEEYFHHAAGLDGNGTGSYIDLVIYRDRDINSGWTSAADGTLEERIYYCQNWRADVSALVTDAGQMLEWVKYSAYGVPFGLPGGDADSDGDCDAGDVSQVETWVEQGPYDVRGDVDLDGDVDEADASTISTSYSGATLGRDHMSAIGVANYRGYSGYQLDQVVHTTYHARHRGLKSTLGRWCSRDPLMEKSLVSAAYLYVDSSPVVSVDPTGLIKYVALKKTCRTCSANPPVGYPCNYDSSSCHLGCTWKYEVEWKPKHEPIFGAILGFVVQSVNINHTQCDGCPEFIGRVTCYSDSATIYEIWPYRYSFSSTFDTLSGGGNNMGYHSKEVEMRFYPIDSSAGEDLLRYWLDNSNPGPLILGGVAQGPLSPSWGFSEPPQWGSPSSVTGYESAPPRSLEVGWECCPVSGEECDMMCAPSPGGG